MKNLILSAALAASVALAQPALAATYEIETPHTQVIFSVNHLGFSNSHGKFTDYEGHFTFDENNVEASRVDVKIKTDSLNMDHEKWNAHLKNADFFNVEQHPEMHFVSTKVEKTGDNTGTLTGDLTMLGVTKPVTLDVTFNKAGVHPYSKKNVVGFSARGTLKRSDFGMTYGVPGVSDEVNLIIEVEGIRQDTEEPKGE
tara:strand:- start:310 stop:906 length:597 start_codon:yes stop_codon:yes gene_type:complete